MSASHRPRLGKQGVVAVSLCYGGIIFGDALTAILSIDLDQFAPSIAKGAGTLATSERRRGERVSFERGINASIMGIDGTWRRDCIVQDVSEYGARLAIADSVDGLHLKEFFLLLSSTGLAFRRCEMAWINGNQIGARFVMRPGKAKPGTQALPGEQMGV